MEVYPERTAIRRYDLSKPFKCLLAHGILKEEISIFDYGCGYGDDVVLLERNGFQRLGKWDPYFFPSEKKEASKIVNLGYVLNVIPQLEERKLALLESFSFAEDILIVSVMLDVDSNVAKRTKPYKDGFVTSKDTFQKLYEQDEIREFIKEVLDVDPVSVAPGIFLCI